MIFIDNAKHYGKKVCDWGDFNVFLITAYESIRILLYEYDNLKFCITYFLRITTATHLSLPHDTTRTAIQNHRSSSRVSMLSSCSAESLRQNLSRARRKILSDFTKLTRMRVKNNVDDTTGRTLS